MKEIDLVRELSKRAGVPENEAHAVVDALFEVFREGGVSADILLPSSTPRLPIASRPDPHAVDDLIARAQAHRLGLDFLLNGYLGSVAAEFGAHAFTVEAARDRIRRKEGEPSGS